MSTLAEIEEAIETLPDAEVETLAAWLERRRARRVGSPTGAHPEHSRVRLVRALPEHGLEAGAEGAVVHVYSGGKGYEVEFLIGMKSPAVITLKPADIERIPNA